MRVFGVLFLAGFLAIGLIAPEKLCADPEPITSDASSFAVEIPAMETLYLENGDHLSGRSLGVENGEILWELTPDEILRVPFNRIDRLEMGPPPAPTPPPVVPVPAPPVEPPPAGPITPDQPQDEEPGWIERVPLISQVPTVYNTAQTTLTTWLSRIALGGQVNEGNSQTMNVNWNAVFERSDAKTLRKFDLGGNMNRADGETTAQRTWLNTNFDWSRNQDDRWILFLSSNNEYNKLNNLNYRGTLSGGVGYRWVKRPDHRLITRLGPAFTTEVFRDPHDVRQTPDIYTELELRWPIFDRTIFEQNLRVQPNIADWELVRVFSTTNLIIPLDGKDRWKFNLGVRYEFISIPSPGRVPSDLITTFSVVYVRK